MTSTVLVTGASSGLGAAIVEALADRGDRVIGLDLETAPANPAADGWLSMDLGDPGSIDAVVDQLPTRVDALCNVAGLHPRSADGNEIVAVNFLGTRSLTESVLPRVQEGGVVFNMGSLGGASWGRSLRDDRELLETPTFAAGVEWLELHPVPRESAYSRSKALLGAWTVIAAQRWSSRGIRSISVAPGPVTTDAFISFRDAIGNPPSEDIDRVGRPGSVEDVVPVVLFMLSREARWVNGVTLPVDGGLLAGYLADGVEPTIF